MKLFKFLIPLILVIAIGIGGLFGAVDRYNQGTTIDLVIKKLADYSDATAFYEQPTSITYAFKATWVDSSDQLHSKPMFIGSSNDVDGYCRAVVNAASDVNVVYHFSYDNKNTWVTITPHTLDALSNTAVGDTLGIESAVNDLVGFHTGIWLIVEFADGSTALEDDEYCIWVGTFTKDKIVTLPNGDFKRIARIATGSYTNP